MQNSLPNGSCMTAHSRSITCLRGAYVPVTSQNGAADRFDLCDGPGDVVELEVDMGSARPARLGDQQPSREEAVPSGRGAAGAAVGVANHQGWPSRSRAPYTRCPYGWSARLAVDHRTGVPGAGEVRVDVVDVHDETAVELGQRPWRGELSVTRCSQMRGLAQAHLSVHDGAVGVRSMPSDVNPNTRTR